jgi:hypothetical protein
MTPSHPINDCSGRHQSRWFAPSNAATCDVALYSKPRGKPILSPTTQPATVPSRLPVILATNQRPRPHRATLLHSQTVAKSP